MAAIDTKKIVRTKAIARFARFIVKHLYNTNWTLIASASGVIEILNAPEHHRVQRAQGFGDNDYPNAIMEFIQHVFDLDEEVGTLLVNEIAVSENAHDEPLTPEAQEELEQILELFGGKDVDILQFVRKNKPKEDFLNIVAVPDDFYKRLVVEINLLYQAQLPFALSVMIRKLFENLVIDILRKKYGTAGITLYYDTSRRRFHDFAVLIKNLDTKKADFHYITKHIDKAIVDVGNFRETGNAGAHSLDANLTMIEFSSKKDNVNYLVQLLLRVLQNI